MVMSSDKIANDWSAYHVRECLTQLRALRDAIENRILPTFMSVDAEGSALAEAEFDRLKALSGAHENPNYDSSGDAQKAEEAKLDYFSLMIGLKQSLINTVTVCMSHLFEQQLLEFLNREIRPEKKIKISTTFRKEFEAELKKQASM